MSNRLTRWGNRKVTSQLHSESSKTRASYLRNSLVIWISDDTEQCLDTIANTHTDPEKLARKLGALKEEEQVKPKKGKKVEPK